MSKQTKRWFIFRTFPKINAGCQEILLTNQHVIRIGLYDQSKNVIHRRRGCAKGLGRLKITF